MLKYVFRDRRSNRTKTQRKGWMWSQTHSKWTYMQRWVARISAYTDILLVFVPFCVCLYFLISSLISSALVFAIFQLTLFSFVVCFFPVFLLLLLVTRMEKNVFEDVKHIIRASFTRTIFFFFCNSLWNFTSNFWGENFFLVQNLTIYLFKTQVRHSRRKKKKNT